MKILEIALSSAVIAAIIKMFIQNKSNGLQYITNERNEWRNDMKLIAEKLYKADNILQMGSALTSLKVNLNSYGRHQEYLDDKMLNIWEDEHIWKEIDYIEKNCLTSKTEKSLKIHKEKLIYYISLLLKFDWERSKREVHPGTEASISIMCFLFSLATMVVEKYGISKLAAQWQGICSMIELLLVPYIILWIPYIIDLFPTLRNKHWYTEIRVSIKLWIVGLIFYVVMWMIKGDNNYLGFILFFVAAFSAMIFGISRRKLYIDYACAVTDTLSLPEVRIYGYGNELSTFNVINYFSQLDINIKNKIIEIQHIDESELQYLIDSIGQNPAKKLLSPFGYVLFKLTKSKYMTLKLFIKTKSKYCRVIVKYKGIYTIGFKKSVWEKWF